MKIYKNKGNSFEKKLYVQVINDVGFQRVNNKI